jgi:hypothetical protein
VGSVVVLYLGAGFVALRRGLREQTAATQRDKNDTMRREN